ncbi:uncharacterized protein [Zea mays]|uniref:uncharacterized protein isoform X2 n=1 Tax=Zea mays TaxID=4577 RepID=UPI000182D75B|nr:uncharacterized protein LOC103654809 isoform X2 [Zea mays]|eukprot:XP_020408481.1 uncharacterized protein LOC103654809 isoform X2 [Zea mays]
MIAMSSTPILLTILLAYLAFSANCNGERGNDEDTPAAGGHRRWQPNGDKTISGGSSDDEAATCVSSECEGSTCYCCPTMPTSPCFLDLDACLRVCHGRRRRRRPAAPLPEIARLFARPLTKIQMEEIMELANHGKGKKINNKKGRKVAPFLAPVAPLALEG